MQHTCTPGLKNDNLLLRNLFFQHGFYFFQISTELGFKRQALLDVAASVEHGGVGTGKTGADRSDRHLRISSSKEHNHLAGIRNLPLAAFRKYSVLIHIIIVAHTLCYHLEVYDLLVQLHGIAEHSMGKLHAYLTVKDGGMGDK